MPRVIIQVLEGSNKNSGSRIIWGDITFLVFAENSVSPVSELLVALPCVRRGTMDPGRGLLQ